MGALSPVHGGGTIAPISFASFAAAIAFFDSLVYRSRWAFGFKAFFAFSASAMLSAVRKYKFRSSADSRGQILYSRFPISLKCGSLHPTPHFLTYSNSGCIFRLFIALAKNTSEPAVEFLGRRV